MMCVVLLYMHNSDNTARSVYPFSGVFMLNLVCRDSALRQSVLERLQAVFPSVLSRPIEGEVNEVLLCSRGGGEQDKLNTIPKELQQAAENLQGTLRSHSQNAPFNPQIDITVMLKDLRVA